MKEIDPETFQASSHQKLSKETTKSNKKQMQNQKQ